MEEVANTCQDVISGHLTSGVGNCARSLTPENSISRATCD